MMKSLPLILLGAAFFLSGCQTYQAPGARAQTTQDQLIQQESQRRMAGRIETLEMEIERLSREIDNLRRSAENRIAAVEQKSEADKRDLVNRLTAQLNQIMNQRPVAATPTPVSSGIGNVSGFEHVVRKGEVLSTIAAAYNVTTKAIIDANKNIKDPDRLQIGQKLFIPE